MKKKKKVLVAMSGGVDSSVVAALLVKKGYDVTGAFMLNYDNSAEAGQSSSCWVQDYRDALRVAARLGIPLLKLDFIQEYKKNVLDYMFAEYEKGRTPNPDVMCNQFVKFGVWLDWAKKNGFDALATGHYATIKTVKEKSIKTFNLMQAKDDNKDQTYFLHRLNQEQLARTLFPIGGYKKDEVRRLARKFDLPTAEREESMGICFIGEVPMREFLEKKIAHKPGNVILSSSGEVVGEHIGLPFYTIGQRHFQTNLSSRNDRPLYVLKKITGTNEIVVGHEDDPLLYAKEIELENVHWINGQTPKFPLRCNIRLRHRQTLQKAEITSKDSKIFVIFKEVQRAATPGQFAVFYAKGECLGGGVII